MRICHFTFSMKSNLTKFLFCRRYEYNLAVIVLSIIALAAMFYITKRYDTSQAFTNLITSAISLVPLIIIVPVRKIIIHCLNKVPVLLTIIFCVVLAVILVKADNVKSEDMFDNQLAVITPTVPAQVSPIPTTVTPSPTPTNQDSQVQCQLTLSRNKDELLEILVADCNVDLNLETLTVKSEDRIGVEHSFHFSDYPAFKGVLSQVSSSICLAFVVSNVTITSTECSNAHEPAYRQLLIPSDVFWFEGGSDLPLWVILDETQVTPCATNNSCTIIFIPPVIPTVTPVPTATLDTVSIIDLSSYMDRGPVTNSEFLQFVGFVTNADGSYSWEKGANWWPSSGEAEEWVTQNSPRNMTPNETVSMPRIAITWYEAVAFCKWRGGDLPTAEAWQDAVEQHLIDVSMINREWINPDFPQTIKPLTQPEAQTFMVEDADPIGRGLALTATFRCIYPNISQ